MGVLIGLLVASLAAAQGAPIGIRVGTFDQEVSVFAVEAQGFPTAEVLGVAAAPDGRVFAGTAQGLYVLKGGLWKPVTGFTGKAASCVAATPAGDVVLVFDGVARTVSGKALGAAPEGEASLCLAASDADVYLGTTRGLHKLAGSAFVPVTKLNALLGEGTPVRAVALGPKGEIVVAAATGLYLQQAGAPWRAVYPRQGDRSWAPVDVRGVAYDTRGRLWFASPQGAGCFNEGWTLYTGAQGLPYNDFTCVAPGVDGAVWFGTHIGAIRFDGSAWAYREGKRWLPGNDVRAVAITAKGEAWFATSGGLGAIELRPMTLAKKAQFFLNEIDKRHRRTPYGYVQSVRLDRPGDKSTWHNRDDDNDGQYTGMYGAAECFAYAVTGDPEAKKRATAAFEALRFLSKVTEGSTPAARPGFVARTILPTSGHDPNQMAEYSVEADQKERASGDGLWKILHPRWPVSKDGEWYWKCDTSSDELDGHFYLYARYFDLVAETEEEKTRVRDVVRGLTDHLIKHDLRLMDWDETPTRWANFSVASLNHDPDWWAERGLNSLSILSHLRVAEHVTGEPKYGVLADSLIREHSYALNGMSPKSQRGPGSFVQFDDEMAFLNYYNLMLYEKDPQVRQMFGYSCFQYWELEECERNSFINFTYAAGCNGVSFPSPWGTDDLSAKASCLADAIDTLKRYPLNHID
jgi:hypothetical protein